MGRQFSSAQSGPGFQGVTFNTDPLRMTLDIEKGNTTLRDKLIEAGIPAEKLEFTHDGKLMLTGDHQLLARAIKNLGLNETGKTMLLDSLGKASGQSVGALGA